MYSILVPESPRSSQGEPCPLLDDDTIDNEPPTSIENGEHHAKASETQACDDKAATTSMDIEAEAQVSVLSEPGDAGEGPADLEPEISRGGDPCESRPYPLLEPAEPVTAEVPRVAPDLAESLTAQPSPGASPQSVSSSSRSRSPLAPAARLPSLQEQPTEEPREQSPQPLRVEQSDAKQAPPVHPSGLHIIERREAYLRRYLKDQYPIQLQTTILAFLEHGRYRRFHVGDFVEVRPRLQPGECKMGGLGYIKKAYTDSPHMYDVKYALGGLDKKVDGNFIISRMDDDSSTRQRKASPRCPGGCGAFAHECRCHARSSTTRRRLQAAGMEDDGRPALKALPEASRGESGQLQGGSSSSSRDATSSQGRKKKSSSLGVSRARMGSDSLTRLGESDEESQASSSRRGGVGAAGDRKRQRDVSSESESSEEEDEGPIRRHGGRREAEDRGRVVLEISDSSGESEGAEEDGGGRAGAQGRHRQLWSEDEEEEGGSEGEDSVAGGEEVEQGEGQQEEEESQESAVGHVPLEHVTLDDEAARQFSRSKAVRGYAVDGGFIRGEGNRNAERVPQEVGSIIRAKGLDKLDKRTLASKVRGLVDECEQKLKRYKKRLRRKLEQLEDAAVRLARETQRRAGAADALVGEVNAGLVWVEEEMRLFTRTSDDVLYYVMKRLRPADEEKYDALVEAFVQRHNGVDRLVKDSMADLRARVRRSVEGGGGYRDELTEESESGESDEEGHVEHGGDESDDDVLLVDMRTAVGAGEKRSRQPGDGASRGPKVSAPRRHVSSERRSGEPSRRRKGTGSGSGSGSGRVRSQGGGGGGRSASGGERKRGTVDDFIVDDVGRRKRRRRENGPSGALPRPPRHGGDGFHGGEEWEGGGQGTEGHQAPRQRRDGGPRVDRGQAGPRQGPSVGRAGSRDGFSTDTGEEGAGDADEAFLFPLSDDEEGPRAGGHGTPMRGLPMMSPLGEDVEAALCHVKATAGGDVGGAGAVGFFPPLPPDFKSTLWPPHPLDEDDATTLGMQISLRESWMAEPHLTLSRLLRRLLSHLSILVSSAPSLPTVVDDRLCKVKACFDVISAHLRAYAHRYPAQELIDLVGQLQQAGLEMERAFCRHGLIPHKDTTGPATTDPHTDLPGLAPLLYHSLLDWFSHLSRLEQQRQQSPSPASAFLPHLLTYVVHHLLAHSLTQPESLSLRLPPPSPTLDDTLRLFQRLAQPLPCLWCRVLDCLPSNGELWPRLLHVIRAQLATSPAQLGDEIRAVLLTGQLEQWTQGVSAAAENREGLQMDLAGAEHLWRLLFDLIRLDMMHAHFRSAVIGTGETRNAAQGAWTIVEVLLQNSPLSLKRASKAPATSNSQATWAERYARQVCPHRYTMLLVHRLRGLIQAWGPPASLTAEVWEALIQGAATRLLDTSGLHDLGSGVLSDRRALMSGLGTRPGGMSAWRWLRDAMKHGAFSRPANQQADWSTARSLLWDLADRRVCDKVDAFLFLPPPSLLHDLQTGDAEGVVRRLVSKGCDEVLLLSSCLLERHMGCLSSPDLRRTFLTGLISRLDSGGNAQLLGLHNLAMALLVLHHKGQAEQKVLVNFWRKLRGACLQGRTDASGHMERALVLSIQFLAQMGPTSAAQPDFLQPATFLDNLVSWFNMTCRTPQETEELAKKLLVPPPRYAPSLKWSLLYGLTLLLQVESHSPLAPPACPSLGPLLTRLVLHYKDLDNACLCLSLYAFRRLCPLPTTQALSPTCPLKLRLPHLSSPPPPTAPPTPPTTLSSWSPSAELLSTLNTLVREAWMGSSTLSEFNVDRCLSLPLHATASLRALSCSLALHQACKAQPLQADCSLLRTSLDCKPSTYSERSSGASQLRLFAPCFYDAYLPFYPAPPLLPSPTFLDGKEWDVLASWLGVTVELALSSSSSSGREGVEQGHISGLAGSDVLPDNRPLRHLRGERYWQLTSRLFTTLRLADEDGSLLLDLSALSQEVPLSPGSSLTQLLPRLPTHERDLVLRLCLLATVFLNIARALLHRLRAAPMQRRNQFKQRMLKLLSLLSGSLRLFAPVRSRKAESQGRKTPGGHAREFAYSVVSLLLRLCPDVAQEKLLDDLLPDLFGPLLLPERRDKDKEAEKEREEGAQGPMDPAFAVQLSSAVDRLGDVVCCLSQVRYSRDAVVSWMRHLTTQGLFLDGATRSLQTRAFRSLCHGLWHACPCHPSDGDMRDLHTQDVRRAMQEVVRLDGQAALMRQIRQEAQPRVDAFRWRFLFELDLTGGLDPSPDLQNPTNGVTVSGGRIMALLRLLRTFYSSFCLCGQAATTTCVNNDIFPILAPLARLLLLSLDPKASVTQAMAEEAWTLVLSIIGCPLPTPLQGNANPRVGAWVQDGANGSVGGPSTEETKQRMRALLGSWIDLLMLIGAVRAGGYRLGEDDGLELLLYVEEGRKRFVGELGKAEEARRKDRSTVSRHLWGVERKADWPTLLLASAVDLGAKGEEVEALGELREAVGGGQGEGGPQVLSQRAAEALQQGLDARRH